MHRYRVYIVPKTGRFAPLLTVLVNADSREEALLTAQGKCARTKAIAAEDVHGGPVPRPRLWSPESGPEIYAPSL